MANHKQKKPVLLLTAIILLVFLGPIAFFFSRQPKSTSAWFNDQWHYRQRIDISSHTSTENNVYISTTIDTSDTTKFQSDCGDLIFTDYRGQILPYFIVSGCTTASTVIHIQLISFPAGAQSIYFYYGNQSATNGFVTTDFPTQASNYTIGTINTPETGGGPVAWWKFDEGSGTTAHDASGSNNTGTLTNGPTWQNEDQCISGKCLYFDGTNDNVTVPNSSSIQIIGNQTISMWIKPTAFGARRNPLAKAYAGEGTLTLESDAKINYYWGTGGGNNSPYINFNSSSTVTLNQWTQIVLVRDISSNKIIWYFNGKKVAETTSAYAAATASTLPLTIGSGDVSPFQGYIDDVKLYNYARSAAEILNDYNNINSLNKQGTTIETNLTIEGLTGYWKFDEGTGTTIKDYSGYNQTLSIKFRSAVNTSAWANGKFGSAYQSAGYEYSNDEAASGNWLAPKQTDFTVMGWIKPSSLAPASSGYIFARWWGDCSESYRPGWALKYFTSNQKLAFKISADNCGPDATLNSNGTLTLDQWNHVAISHKTGESIKIYINGILDASQSYTLGLNPNASGIISFGCNSNNNDCGFPGLTDEVKIYNKTLSDTEIYNHYLENTSSMPELIRYFDFEDLNSSTINSKTNTQSTATLINSPKKITSQTGSGISLNGINQYLDLPDNPLAGLSQTTFEIWAYGDFSTNTQKALFGSDGGGPYWRTTNNSNLLLYLKSSNCTTENATYTNNILLPGWHHYAFTVEPSGIITIYADGVIKNSYTFINWDNFCNTSTYWSRIGDYANGYFWDGAIDEVKIYNYARTPAQILQDMQGGVVSSGTTTKIPQPLIWYNLNESKGTTIFNKGILKNTGNGTLAADTAMPNWTKGKDASALNFDGVNDYVSTVTGTTLGLTNQLSISTWFKGTGTIISSGNTFCGTAGDFYLTHTGFSVKNSSCATSTLTFSPTTTEWNHAVATVNGTNMKLYLNGQLTDSLTDLSGYTTLKGADNIIRLGSHTSGNSFFTGQIDEVKIYNYELSESEVKQDYNSNSTTKVGSTNQTINGTTTSLEYCPPGDTATCYSPVAEYDFEEGQGTTANDKSGNANNGTLVNNPTWTQGKIGKGMQFNGNGNYINLGNKSSLQDITTKTISFWIKLDSQIGSDTTGSHIMNKGDQWFIATDPSNNRNIFAQNFGSGNGRWSFPLISTGTWHFISIVYNNSSANNNPTIYVDGVIQTITEYSTPVGTVNSDSVYDLYLAHSYSYNRWVNGSIDQVRIYNYARTPAQIAWEYNRGKPIAQWKMDECQGSVIHDSSGNNLHGTLTIGASGTQTAIGTCNTASSAWGNGATGKINSSLNFDGTDDNILLPGSNIDNIGKDSDFSVSAWNYQSSFSGIESIITQAYGAHTYGRWQIGTNGSKGFVSLYGGSSSTSYKQITGDLTLPTNEWFQLTAVYNRTLGKISLYINGKLDKEINWDGYIENISTNRTYAGYNQGTNSQKLSGQIDDVQIYNYALTAEQVKSVYNGSALNFAPAE